MACMALARPFTPSEPLGGVVRQLSINVPRQRQPVSGGVHLLFGQGQFSRAYVFIGVELDLLEADHLGVHPHIAVILAGGAERRAGRSLEDLDLGVVDRVREIIAVNLVDVSLAFVIVEALDVNCWPSWR